VIDLHCHILCGLDDGAEDMEASIAMARLAYDDGIRTIVATPHGVSFGGLWRSGCSVEETAERVTELCEELSANGLAGLGIMGGVENYIEPQLAKRFDEGSAFTLAGTRYILVELPFQSYPAFTDQALFELQARGLVPIIAHPERNLSMQRQPQLLERLVERGMMTQVTAASLLGTYGSTTRKAAEEFLLRGLAQVIASDAHGTENQRGPALSPGVAAAQRLVGEERAWAMVTTTPEAILADERPDAVAVASATSRRRWVPWRRR